MATKTPKKSASRSNASVANNQPTNYGPLALILALVLVAIVAFVLGAAAMQTSAMVVANEPTPTSVAPNPTQGNPEVENAPAQPAPATDRISRLVELDAIYRSSGWQAWLKAAGVSCDANVEARQPEEETVVYNGETRVVVSGLQVKGNCTVPYPALVTTDRPGDVTTSADSRTYQPDLKNPSVLYTNVQLHGQGTIWVDGSNWGQLDPTKP